MKKIILILCCLPFLTASTCTNDDSPFRPCTAEAKAGLNVSVSLGSMNSITSEGVTVIATDGDFAETLTAPFDNDPVFSGVYERVGSYIITVSKEGYQTFTTETIVVGREVCHVIPRILHVSLQPQ